MAYSFLNTFVGRGIDLRYPPPPHISNSQLPLKLKLKLIYDQQSAGQSVLVSGAHLEPVTNFYFSLKFPLDSCGFVIL
jgi:hypothetical protein